MDKFDSKLLWELLVVFGSFAAPIAGVVVGLTYGPQQADEVAMLSVEGLCCEINGRPAEAALKKVAGIVDVIPDYERGAIKFRLTSPLALPAVQIRDALAVTRVRPVRLDFANKSFSFGSAK